MDRLYLRERERERNGQRAFSCFPTQVKSKRKLHGKIVILGLLIESKHREREREKGEGVGNREGTSNLVMCLPGNNLY